MEKEIEDFVKQLNNLFNNYPVPGYIQKSYEKMSKEDLELELQILYETIEKNENSFGINLLK